MFGAFVVLLIFGLWKNSDALNGQTYTVEHKKANSPDSNFCVYSLEATRVLINCFIEQLPPTFAKEFTNAVMELFGGQPLTESLKMICRSNGDDGEMLFDTWINELEDELRPSARLAAWNCYEEHEEMLTKDIS